jgi:SAM-dependent methyltransferase
MSGIPNPGGLLHNASSYGDTLAEVYDQLYPGSPDADQAAEFISELSPKGRILELGVGTGRLALRMAAKGLQVHGVDASPKILQKLRDQDSENNVLLTEADFSEELPEGDFDVALIALNTLFMLPDPEKQIDTLKLMRSRVGSGGRVVVETYNPSIYHNLKGPEVSAHHLEDGVVCLATAYPHPGAQTIVIVQTLLGVENDQRLVEVSRYAWPSELDLMARLAGLRIKARYSSWSGETPTHESPRYVSVYEVASDDS